MTIISKQEQLKRLSQLSRVGLDKFSPEFIKAYTSVADNVWWKIKEDSIDGIFDWKFETQDSNNKQHSFGCEAGDGDWYNHGQQYEPNNLADPNHPDHDPSLIKPTEGLYVTAIDAISGIITIGTK